MAADKLKYSDLDSGALEQFISNLREMKTAYDSVIESQKEVLKQNTKLAQSESKTFDNVENIKATEKAINEVENAVTSLQQAQKEQAKLDKQLEKLHSVGAKRLEELEVATSNLKNELKKLAKEEKAGTKTTEQAAKERAKLKTEIKLYENNIRESRAALIKETKAQVANTKEVSKADKLRTQLKQLTSEQAKEEAILTARLNESRKALRAEAKEAIANRNAYEELVKSTNEAQAEFKKLAVQFGINSQEAREAGKNFDKLDAQLREVNDAARDGRRDVGRYQIATEKLNNSLKKFGVGAGAILIITKAFEGLQNVVGNNAEAGAGLEKVLGTITVTFTVLLSRLVKAFPLLISLIKDSFSGIKVFFKEMQLSYLETTNILGRNSDQIKVLKKEITDLQAAQKGNVATTGDLADAFTGMGDEIVSTIEKNNKLVDSTLASRKRVIQYQNAINGLIKTQAELQAAADNENNSLLDRIAAQEKLLVQTAKINELEIKIAKERVNLAAQNAKVFKDSIDAREALAQANTDLIALEVEQTSERQAQLTELSTLEADVLEQRLDFLIDNFDNQKTVNERIIADEKNTFEERQRLLAENEKLATESYDAQLQAFNERLAEQGKGQLDFEKLVNESDSRLIAQEALNAGLSERLTTRLLEVIRERRTVIQDNVEATNDLNDAVKDSNDLEKETTLNTETLNKLKEDGVDVELVLQQLEEKRLSLEIQNLQTRIALAKALVNDKTKTTEEIIKLEKDLSEKLLEEQQARLEKEKEAEEKAAEKRKEIQEGVADFLEKLNEKIFSKRISKIEEAIDKEKEREDQLRELARQGVQDAENNLAVTQKRQAELEREREQALKRQKAFELGLAAARAYSANVATGDGNALVKTITDISLLEAFIDSLAGFYEGTDLVKNDLNPTVKGKDGYVIRVDGDERIFNPAQNKAVSSLGSNLNNWELVRLAQVGKSLDSQTSNLGDNLAVLNAVNGVKRAIEGKPSYLGREYDRTERSVIDTYQEKGRITRKHYKKAQGFLSKPD